MTDSERILEVIRAKGLSNVQFCNITGISAATLSHITSGRSNPTLTIFRSIIKGFPDLNPLWVYQGEGDMYRELELEDGEEEILPELPPATINNKEELVPGARPASAESAAPVSSVRNSRAATAASPDLFGGLDALLSADLAKGAKGAGSSALTEVVRETIAQVQPQPRRPHQITEIRIFFDDGTYESFGGPK